MDLRKLGRELEIAELITDARALNPGEAAILALGRTRKLPWNHKEQVRSRSVTTLSLSFDHRLVDGELGSTVLAEIAELLEHPAHTMAR